MNGKHLLGHDLTIVTVKVGTFWEVKVVRRVTLKVYLSTIVKDGPDDRFNDKTLNAGLRVLHEENGICLRMGLSSAECTLLSSIG